jgi:hypothetical protein
MAQQRRINASELDFDTIKSNLITYMKATDTTFNDYNYDGSAMNTIIDVLSYITHINSINANFALNETFLDTAQLRSSVVSHAKLLGYTPRSITPSVSYVNVVMNYDNTASPLFNHDSGDNPLPLVIARGAKFQTIVDAVPYAMFASATTTVNWDSTAAAGAEWHFDNIKLEQGELHTSSFTFQNNEFERYVLADSGVNTKSIKVTIKESSTSTNSSIYTLYSNIVNIDSNSKIFFLEEAKDGFYEVKFGDGIIGKKPDNGNIVEIEYSTVNETNVNGASVFTLVDGLGAPSNTNGTLTTVTKGTGGAAPESSSSIRFNAPLGFVAQNRAVTPDDYKTIIKNNYGNIDTLTVWGGEDNIPPDYGKVYVSIKPLDAEVVSDTDKLTIINNYLKPKNVVSITPVLVDPDYTYLNLEIFFKYNPNVANVTVNSLAEAIRTTITTYNDDTLKDFGGVFRHSNVVQLIDSTNISIISNITRVKMHKEFTPDIGTTTKYQFDFNQALAKTDTSYITSSQFVYNGFTCILKDYYNTTTSSNVIQIITATDGLVKNADAGTVDETTGRVILSAFDITSIVDTSATKLTINTKPASSDVKPTRNELLTIKTATAAITGEVDTMATGGTTAGIDYTTTSNNA